MGSCAHSHGRGAGTWRPALTGVVSLLVLLAGCAMGGDVEVAGIRPPAELAQEAEVATENQAHGAPGRRGTTPAGPAVDPAASTTAPGRPETSGVVTWDELAAREVQGVGIDLFRSRSGESDYQVLLSGGRHGWRAFLRTPDGFVEFPGFFTVHGRDLRVVVPWSSLGGRADAEVSVFSDWSSGVGRLSADGTPRALVSPG